VWGVAPSCWNHWRTLTTPFHRPSAVQNLPSTWTYCSVLIVTDCLLSSSNQNGPMMPCLEMATQAVYFTECNGLCRQFWGDLLPQKMLFLEFTWPDNRKCASSENQTSRKSGTASILSQNHWHMITRFHVVRCKLLFNLYPTRIHVEICNQNSPHKVPVDSKLLTLLTHSLVWAVDNRVCDSSNVVWCPWWFQSSRMWLSVSWQGYAQSHGFWTCWPICRSLSGQEIYDIRTVLWITIELRG